MSKNWSKSQIFQGSQEIKVSDGQEVKEEKYGNRSTILAQWPFKKHEEELSGQS